MWQPSWQQWLPPPLCHLLPLRALLLAPQLPLPPLPPLRATQVPLLCPLLLLLLQALLQAPQVLLLQLQAQLQVHLLVLSIHQRRQQW